MALILGATCHPLTYTVAAYNTDNALMGPLKIGRYFNTAGTAFPADWSHCLGSQDAPSYITPFQSVKVPNNDYSGFISGTYDTSFKNLVATIPSGTWFTINHEPENDMPGSTFVSLFRHAYTMVQAVNTNLVMGPVHEAYPYGTVSGQVASVSAYDVGDAYKDFTGVDLYGVTNIAAHPERYVTLENDTYWGFQQWWQYYSAHSVKGYALVERGLMSDPNNANHRSSVLQDDIAFCLANNFVAYIYWNGTGSQGDWSLNSVSKDYTTYAGLAAEVNNPPAGGSSAEYLAGAATAGIGSTTLVITLSHAVAAGDAIVVGINSNAAVLNSITDSKGQNWTIAKSDTAQINTYAYVSLNSVAMAIGATITLTFSASTGGLNAVAVGCPGVITASAVDKAVVASSSGSTSPSVASGALAQPNEVCIAIQGNGNGGGAITWASGWTQQGVNQVSGTQQHLAVATQNPTTSASLTASGTLSTSSKWEMMMITLKTSSSPPPANTVILAALGY